MALDDKLIQDPFDLAEIFNSFFKEKVQKLVESIKKDPKIDPFSRLKEKVHGLNLKFKIKTANEKTVFKILKSLKPKRSYGIDGISSEIL